MKENAVLSIIAGLLAIIFLGLVMFFAFQFNVFISKQYTQPRQCYNQTETFEKFNTCLNEHYFTIKFGS